jgi:hypothetical protein
MANDRKRKETSQTLNDILLLSSDKVENRAGSCANRRSIANAEVRQIKRHPRQDSNLQHPL